MNIFTLSKKNRANPLLITLALSLFVAFSVKANDSERVSDLRVYIDDAPTSNNFVEYNSKLFFTAHNAENQLEVYLFDPLTDTTTSIANFNGLNLTVHNDKLYFTHRHQIWSYDEHSNNLLLVTDVNDTNGSESPNHLTVYNGELYFTVITDTYLDSGEVLAYKYSLWAYNEELETTRLIIDMNSEVYSYFERFLVIYDNKLFFNFDSLENGNELWAYDSETTTADFIADLGAREFGQPETPVVFNEKLFLNNRDESSGFELWSYNAKTGDFKMVADINQGQESSSPASLTPYRGQLFFTAYDELHGEEVWLYDDIIDTHILAFETVEGKSDIRPDNLISFDNKLFFNAKGREFWKELWFYDGTSTQLNYAHTHNVIKHPESLIGLAGKLYYSTYGGGIYRFGENTNSNTAPSILTPIEYSVDELTELTLDASNSSDADGDQLSYSWIQLSGITVNTENSTSSIFTVFTPEVSTDEVLTFGLTVNDGIADSSAEITINIKNVNNSPSVSIDAHGDEFDESTIITLNASGVDSDNDDLTYEWMQVSGPQVSITETTNAQLQITLPEVSEDASIEFEVIVSDGVATSKASTSFVIKNTTSSGDNDSNVEEPNDTENKDSGGAIYWLLIIAILCRISRKY